MAEQETDILIIGAGPSGTVAAAYLIDHFPNVKIVERAQFPRFVIGESLIPRCMDHLSEVGLLEVLAKQGFQKKQGAKFIRGDQECLFDFGEQYTDGWKWTYQMHRADFDKTLADEVQRRGVDIEYETTVTNIEFQGSRSLTTVEKKDGSKSQIRAKYIIDASGFGRVIPRMFDLVKPSTVPARQTLFAHFEDTNYPTDNLDNQIIIIIHRRDLWIWVIPFSDGTASVGFVGNPALFDAYENIPNAEERLRTMIGEVPSISSRFAKAKMVLPAKSMKAWGASSTKLYGEGFVIAGNSAEFIDPVFSSGVTFATESGLIAAKLVCRQLKGESVDWEQEYVKHIEQGVEVFRTYINSWYEGGLQDLFFFKSDNEYFEQGLQNGTIKQQICSVLAGYVWDTSNPYVKKHSKAINALSKLIKIY